jgi:serine/threonine protein kinase
MDFHVGQTFGEYAITGILRASSMGRVYKVEHHLTKRTEAMKVLTTENATENQIQRFEREMRILARLSHPNIAVLHNALHSEQQLILLMEFIEGQTLESLFGAGRLPIDTGVGYIRQILLALRYSHQQGVVHRDVTPSNVLVTAANEVKLTDFGLSKSFGDPLLTNCGEILGSLPYLAPEQLKGVTRPDRRSDLYAVGAILYEHLTGQKPFGANRRLAAVLTDSEAEPRPPSKVDSSLSPRWDEVIHRALARDPGLRYQSAEEFLEAVGEFDQTPAAKSLLPQPRTLWIGISISAGLVLALLGSPAINPFGAPAPFAAPLKVLHVAPPDFALAFARLASEQTTSPATPPPAKLTEVARSKRAARSSDARVFERNPGAETSKNDLTPSPPGPGQDVNETLVAPKAESGVSEATTSTKKKFWNKLNIFKKKKNADLKEEQ